MEPLSISCSVEAEPLERYRPGGYHPVHLGDLFKQGRYKIIHKIGWGGYSTAWVARDLIKHRNVAVKVSVSEKKDHHEAQVLRAISALPDHPGRTNLVQMLDDFTLDGPNGTHDCLVLELLGPSVQHVIEYYKNNRLPAAVAKATAQQALQALDFLSQQQITHADIHTGNMAFQLPSLEVLDETQLFNILGKPEMDAIQVPDGRTQTVHVPSYIVAPVSFAGNALMKNLSSLSTAKIIDFGQSFLRNQTPPTMVHTPLPVRAPEAVFGETIDYRADIWSMGCSLFELLTGRPPFDVIMLNMTTLVSQMIDLCTDELPARWRTAWQEMGALSSDDTMPCTFQELMNEIYFDEERHGEFTKEQISSAGELVGRMLKFEPSTRASVSEILKDPWFKN